MKKLGILFATVIMIMLVALSVSANDNTYKSGDIIQFGTYPQTEVKDENLIAQLNALTPAWNNWISYDYYSGTGSGYDGYDSMENGDWMRYIDITYNGNKYRGVKFTEYRPYQTINQQVDSLTRQDDNGYRTNTIYWFKFEPIDWRILDPANGLVMSENIIDSQPYSNTIYSNGGGFYGYFNDTSYKNYASDYETSSIRQWLNNDFYNTAFTDSEKKEISTTTLNNDGYYTSVGTTGYEKLDSNETKDKIFLLSYNEVRNSNFGFSSDQDEYDAARFGQGSDYAQSQGLYVWRFSGSTYIGNSYWLLRSPGSGSYGCFSVDISGFLGGCCDVSATDQGIRPALRFNRISDIGQSEHQHDYNLVEIAPTCISAGTKTYTCTCGDTYTETIPATNHPNATTDAGKSPTTIEVGYTAGKYCPDCKTWIEGHTEIPKLEEHKHSYTSTITKEATCWREGEKTYTCTCGESYTEAIAKLDHEYRPWETKKNPTCTSVGLEWSYCLICDNDFEREIPATGHTIIDYTRRATPDSDGAYVTACDVCNEVFKSISFGRPTEFKLSTAKYTYDGKTKTPKLTVETSDGVVLKEGVDYELELPSGRKAVGVYTYRVVFKGNFLGEKKVSYQILPGKTSKITATQSTSAIKLTWKKVTGADGYRVYQYNSKTGKYEKIKTTTGTSYTVKKLKAGTTYKFAVKAYTKDNGETLWAASYKTFTTATKPATPTVKATAGSKQATISWNKVTGATGYVVYMQDDFGDYNKIGSTKKTSYTRKKLTKGKTYYFRVRAYKTVDGKNIYGGYKTVKVKVK